MRSKVEDCLDGVNISSTTGDMYISENDIVAITRNEIPNNYDSDFDCPITASLLNNPSPTNHRL